jgi:hypothetical protein
MITANKGEWSELYTLFKILGEKRIYSGDGQLNRLDTFYPVISVIRDELNRHLVYTLNNDIVVLTEEGNEFLRISVSDFLDEATKLFSEIRNVSNKSAFPIPSLDSFLSKINCQKVKAKSQDKADIHVVIHDYHTGMQPELGFSIKSEAGSSPTLLNASEATLFKYRIKGADFDDEKMEAINGIDTKRKIQDRVNAINKENCELEFVEVSHKTFSNNLRMIDGQMPEIIAWLMANSYLRRDMNLATAVEQIKRLNPLKYDDSCGHDFYGYKVRSLLVVTALGMLPATTWNGRYDATGGYIVVKDDGDIICFHIYDRNMLEDYLFNNTKFETPTGKRYCLGKIYKEKDGQYYFNLVLQIRFI